MKKQHIYTLLLLVSTLSILAQQTPAPKQVEDYSIIGATAHIGNGSIIKDALIVFSEGKITYVGNNNSEHYKGKKINANGKHVYPGFIIANSTLGLGEIDAVRASIDDKETGSILPHIRSLIAYNAESKVVETMRPNGVLIGQITPRGGLISGTSSVVQFDAWNWEDAAIKVDDAIHLNWPSNFAKQGKWWLGEKIILVPNKRYKKNIANIQEYFSQAKNYLSKKNNEVNLSYKACKGLFDGSQKLFIHVNGSKAITDAIHTFINLGIKNLVIVGGKNAENSASLLTKYKVPVVISRSHSLPDNEDEEYDAPYRTAKILTDKGIVVGLCMTGDMERMNTRNLPFNAGTYAAYGLDKEKALQLITQNNAIILGIDNIVGTLETGKQATLFISEGDALDIRGNIITDAFIQGRKISLETRQTKLWKKYSNKYKKK